MTEQTAVDDDQLAADDPRAAQLLATWRQLDERNQQVVIATAAALAAFSRFQNIDPETRRLALRLLENPSDAELRALHERPAGGALAEWLLSLPGYLGDQRPETAQTRPEPRSDPLTPERTPSVDVRGDVSRLFHRATPTS
jgi:hypothetical protein